MHPDLIEALRTGDIKTLESLIASGMDIKQTDAMGNTALIYAVAFGQIPMVDHLLSKKYATANEKNKDGNTALLTAAANGLIPMLEHLLVKKYARATERNNYGTTALHMAALKGHIPMLEHLLAKKYATLTERTNTGTTALLLAVACGQIPMVEHLLAKKYATMTEKDNNGNTALLVAAENNQIAMLEHLLAKNYATLTEKNNYKATAFLIAAENGQITLMDYLLTQKYAALTEKTDRGNTALLIAARNGDIPMLGYLLTRPEVNLQERNTSEGDNVLTMSAWKGHSTAVAYLLKRGAYIDLSLNDGRSPVQVIQGHSNQNALPLLQAAEALIQVASGKRVYESPVPLVQTLGENLNARRVLDGNTALHLAIINKNLPLIELLLEYGADVTMPNKDQETPFQLLQRVHFNDPYILAYCHMQNIAKIAKNLDQQQNVSAGLGPVEDVKQSFESRSHDAGDTKRGSEGLTIVELQNTGLQNKNTPLFSQCAAFIEAFATQLEKMPIATEEQRKEKQGLCYKAGALLANPLSSVYNPVAAYNFLSQITKESTQFPEAQGLMAELLISGNIIFQNSGLEAEPVPAAVSASMGVGASTEDAAGRALRQKAIIKHLLQGSSKHEDVIGHFIAEYTLGAEKSVAGLANVKGKDVDSQMALIEVLRERELENKLLQEKLQAFSLMQERLRTMEAENRRLAQENAALKNQNLDKDKPVSDVPKTPKGGLR